MSHCTDYAKDHDTEACADCAADLVAEMSFGCRQADALIPGAEHEILKNQVRGWKRKTDEAFEFFLASSLSSNALARLDALQNLHTCADFLRRAAIRLAGVEHRAIAASEKARLKGTGKGSDTP